MLGTSKTKHDSKGFELFITTAPIPDLNDKLTVFGRVVKGEDVVQVWDFFLDTEYLQLCPAHRLHLIQNYFSIKIQEIEEVDTDEHYQPKSNIGIIDVTLKREV